MLDVLARKMVCSVGLAWQATVGFAAFHFYANHSVNVQNWLQFEDAIGITDSIPNDEAVGMIGNDCAARRRATLTPKFESKKRRLQLLGFA